MNTQPSGRFSKPWLWGAVAIGVALTAATVWDLGMQTPTEETETAGSLPVPTKVVALGRLEPSEGILQMAPPTGQDGARVAELRVEEGSQVTRGQIIAVLDSSERLKDAMQQAQAQVEAARAKLTQVQAGAKQGEILAQKAVIARLEADRAGALTTQQATITRLEAEVSNAQLELNRFEQLYQAGAIAASERDRRQLTLETAQAQLTEAIAKQQQNQTATSAELTEARATLSQISEVRSVDVKTAKTEVDVAIAALQQTQTDLEQTYIRAPQAGRILKIHSRVGEQITESLGIADLAPTQTMIVIAEVYESDITKIKLGQTATIAGETIFDRLTGTVVYKGEQIIRQTVFSNQPGENLDRRVVEVKIRLNPTDSQRVATLTNLQVRAEIGL